MKVLAECKTMDGTHIAVVCIYNREYGICIIDGDKVKDGDTIITYRDLDLALRHLYGMISVREDKER